MGGLERLNLMSSADISKWNKKYAASEISGKQAPDEELIRYADLLPNSGLALDLACGLGKNALYLAQQGLDVVALDGSSKGLAVLDQAANTLGLSARLQTLQADLDEYALPEAHFDLIVVVRYLNPPLFPAIAAALKPGGVLLYKTFNRKVLESRPHFNASFTIEQDALCTGFSNLLSLQNQYDEHEYSFLLAKKQA